MGSGLVGCSPSPRIPSDTSGISTTITASSTASRRPNIVVFVADDHGEQAISAYGRDLLQTPAIDRLATEGVRFANSFVSNAICAPSRAALLTGAYSHRNGVLDNDTPLDGGQPTFPQVLQAEGYRTALIGKWHLQSAPTGFDTYQILTGAFGQGKYYNPDFDEDGVVVRREGYVTEILTEKALDFVRDAGDAPFLLLVHHKAPHRNWMPALEHLGSVPEASIEVPGTFFDDYATRALADGADNKVRDLFLSQDMKLLPRHFGTETATGGHDGAQQDVEVAWADDRARMTDAQRAAWDRHYDPIGDAWAEAGLDGDALSVWKLRRYLADYLATVRSLDDGVGHVLDYLEEAGLDEHTLVIYTSDQGFFLGEHGWYDKRWMYDPALRTPLLMRFPGRIQPGSVRDELVTNVDLAPTVLDVADAPVPAEVQGRSLGPLFRGPAPADWRQSIYYHYYDHPQGWHDVPKHFGVRTGTFKLIRFFNDAYSELFDLQRDPHELENVYDDPDYRGVAEELEAELSRLRRELGDQGY